MLDYLYNAPKPKAIDYSELLISTNSHNRNEMILVGHNFKLIWGSNVLFPTDVGRLLLLSYQLLQL